MVVKDGGENGNVIHTETLGTLSSGQSKDISLVEIWNKATRNDISGTKILYLEVSQEETEYELWNNSIVLERRWRRRRRQRPSRLLFQLQFQL